MKRNPTPDPIDDPSGYQRCLLSLLGHDDPAEVQGWFGTLRRANLELWSRTTPAVKARVGLHAERGRESLDLRFRLIAGHDRLHLDQATRGLAAIEDRSVR